MKSRSKKIGPFNPPAFKYDIAENLVEGLKKRVTASLIVEEFTNFPIPDTAQEVLDRANRQARALGESYGRLQSALLTPLTHLTIKQLEETNMIKSSNCIKNPHPKAKDKFFVVQSKADLYQLKGWLQNRKYNTFVESQDKNGKPLIGLLWDYHLGRFPSPSRGKRGVILVTDKNLLKPSLINAINHLSVECSYGDCWRKQQMDLVLYDSEFF